MFFTNEFLQARRQDFVDSITTAQANIGTPESPEWKNGTILKADVTNDGLIIFTAAFLDLVYSTASVCQIRLYDKDNILVNQRDVDVDTVYGQGVYTKLTINLFESNMEVI